MQGRNVPRCTHLDVAGDAQEKFESAVGSATGRLFLLNTVKAFRGLIVIAIAALQQLTSCPRTPFIVGRVGAREMYLQSSRVSERDRSDSASRLKAALAALANNRYR